MNWQSIKIYLFGGILIIAVLGAVFFFANEVQKSSQELLSQKKEFLLAEQKLNDMEGARQKYEERKKDLEKVNALFINDPTDPTGFTDFLRKLVTNPLGLGTIKNKRIEKPPALSFSLSFSDSFPNLLRFIDKVERGPFMTEITSLNIRGTGQGVPSNITANLEIIVLSK